MHVVFTMQRVAAHGLFKKHFVDFLQPIGQPVDMIHTQNGEIEISLVSRPRPPRFVRRADVTEEIFVIDLLNSV